jgi:hypothetical protein
MFTVPSRGGENHPETDRAAARWRMTHMLPARRMVPVAALALLGALGLAGCRAQPTVAAYVENTKVTEKQVDDLVANATTAAAKPEEQGTRAPSRVDVVSTIVLNQLCDELQRKEGFAKPPVSTEQIRQSEGTPSVSEYAKIRANLWSCLSGVPVGSQEPTDAELRELYDLAKAAGAIDVPYEDIKAQLAADQSVRQALAIDRTLTEAAKAKDISVNPRYRPLMFPVFTLQSGDAIVSIPMGELGSEAVRDLS